MKKINIIGQRFNGLVALRPDKKDKYGRVMWLFKCDCGNKTICSSFNVKFGTTKSCGCLKRRKGNDNPRTITDPERKKQKKRSYAIDRRWRGYILKRDGFRCQKCGGKNNLNVHHIYGYADFPEKQTDKQNGITLCYKCHMDFHIKYGRKTGFDEACLNEWFGGERECSPIVNGNVYLDKNTFNVIMAIKNKDLEKAKHYLELLIELSTGHSKNKTVSGDYVDNLSITSQMDKSD